MMSPKFHIAKRKYVKDVFSSLISSLVLSGMLLSFFLEEVGEEMFELSETHGLITIIACVLLLVTQLILRWLILQKHVFYDQAHVFIVEKGLFFKRKASIPYKNIHAISIKRSIIDLILGLSTLEIDTGATISLDAEGKLVLDKAYAVTLKAYLENKKHDDQLVLPSPDAYEKEAKEKQNQMSIKWYHLLLLSVTNAGFLKILSVLFIGFFGLVATLVIWSEPSDVSEPAEPIIFIFLIILLIISIGSMLYHLITYYRYHYEFKDHSITYAYGLFYQVEFKIPLHRINAVHMKQSLLFRLFKYYELSVSVIGIGQLHSSDQAKIESKSILLMAKKSELMHVLDQMGYGKTAYEDTLKPHQFKYLNFLILPLSVLIGFSILPYVIFELQEKDVIALLVFELFLILFIALGLYLKMNQQTVKMNDETLFFQRGSYTLKQSIIKRQKIQMLSYVQTPLLLIEKIGNLRIFYKDIGGFINLYSYSKESFDYIESHLLV